MLLVTDTPNPVACLSASAPPHLTSPLSPPHPSPHAVLCCAQRTYEWLDLDTTVVADQVWKETATQKIRVIKTNWWVGVGGAFLGARLTWEEQFSAGGAAPACVSCLVMQCCAVMAWALPPRGTADRAPSLPAPHYRRNCGYQNLDMTTEPKVYRKAKCQFEAQVEQQYYQSGITVSAGCRAITGLAQQEAGMATMGRGRADLM